MYVFNKVEVTPTIPDKIERLEEIANNIWWVWNTDFLKLFKLIDEEVWDKSEKNPVKFLKNISQEKLEKASKEEQFISEYEKVLNSYDEYMNEKNTYFNEKYPEYKDDVFAYFSAEYGLDETIPIYSGGLGVLSGDHMKTASDIGIPYVGLGLLYKEGYFDQKIDEYGNQTAEYKRIDLDNMPINPVKNENGEDLIVDVKIGEETVYIKAWVINVGRNKIYLLDTDVKENTEKSRQITFKLYGGDQNMRISQEIVLGFGSLKLLRALNIEPKLYHMNEGHSAFLILKLIEEIVEKEKVPFKIAAEMVKIRTIFTTHTAVPAGTDIFSSEMMEKYFNGYWEKLGLTKEEFLRLGLSNEDENIKFNMTKFAIRFSGKRNGVSKLHGEVSKELFQDMWENIQEEEVPIRYVTNGVHIGTWMSADIKKLVIKYFGDNWLNKVQKQEFWNEFAKVSNEELWYEHKELKKKMFREVRRKNKERLLRNGVSFEKIKEIEEKINPEALTIGFAIRFATYKRATMIFKDIERLTQILNDESRPVQIIFAGKAHPADIEGQNLIKKINEISMMPQFKGKIILLENYNMAISRFLISGVDVWLNTPRRPLEASGTSGQKAAINGVLNFSTSDGWWEEGCNKENGWVIGNRDIYSSIEGQDKFDSQSLYNILENEIIPMYYERKDGVPEKWTDYMKNSIIHSAYNYTTSRMFIDYIEEMYKPALNIINKKIDDIQKVEEFVKWEKEIQENWDNIVIRQDEEIKNLKIKSGETINIKCWVNFNGTKKEDADVELYVVKIKESGKLEKIYTTKMTETGKTRDNEIEFETIYTPIEGGNIAYTYRVLPKHEMLLEREDLKAIKWFMV